MYVTMILYDPAAVPAVSAVTSNFGVPLTSPGVMYDETLPPKESVTVTD